MHPTWRKKNGSEAYLKVATGTILKNIFKFFAKHCTLDSHMGGSLQQETGSKKFMLTCYLMGRDYF